MYKCLQVVPCDEFFLVYIYSLQDKKAAWVEVPYEYYPALHRQIIDDIHETQDNIRSYQLYEADDEDPEGDDIEFPPIGITFNVGGIWRDHYKQ